MSWNAQDIFSSSVNTAVYDWSYNVKVVVIFFKVKPYKAYYWITTSPVSSVPAVFPVASSHNVAWSATGAKQHYAYSSSEAYYRLTQSFLPLIAFWHKTAWPTTGVTQHFACLLILAHPTLNSSPLAGVLSAVLWPLVSDSSLWNIEVQKT